MVSEYWGILGKYRLLWCDIWLWCCVLLNSEIKVEEVVRMKMQNDVTEEESVVNLLLTYEQFTSIQR
ncbi:predicted protein [Sclerotinia sclerotiorum 1980 UF-70]|uniref:Uncharacterized protein n=1 Tax=Sclerotinia sclerotiorum (strain ATCC 18683 / 1980 / Ss-1) TaxID=665079 RepID=A7EIH4_SCLS1|nr:predicted protein [Sclerotinia sclerotiorum 1980 UF-70]EDO02640.1 predicted protein [Sclerotinia sclerotiorum 1980 UF-70]